MANVDHTDKVLLAAITDRWSKAAMVVARAMSNLPGQDDTSLQQRLVSLA